MKKSILSVFFVSLLLIAYTTATFAGGKPFKGTIIYDLTYTGDIDPATLSQLPKEITKFIYGNKSKTEVNQGGAYITEIQDGDAKTQTVLLDIEMMGKKFVIRKSAEEVAEEMADLPESTIKYIDETKEIAGYICKKGELITKDDDGEESISVFYYTEQLGNKAWNFGTEYSEVDGAILEYEEGAGNFSVKLVARIVKKGKVKETDFLVPSDFEEVSSEQLREMFGG